MRSLAIESSCDETAAAVLENGRRVLSNVIATQVEIHARYGGVVPEIASRAHLEQIIPVVEQALAEADCTLSQIDRFVVTRGPGLIGSLLVGVEFAKSLAFAQKKPLLAIHHIAGHAASPNIGRTVDAWGIPVGEPAPREPYVALTISGGHSSLLLVRPGQPIQILGETLDDAVGEAYDKVAKLLGLGYPGGPLVDRLAATGDPTAFDFPRPLAKRPGLDFSFSGLKTAVARSLELEGGTEALAAQPQRVADFCASFQAACLDVLFLKARRALKQQRLRRLAIVGGVACNRGLRSRLTEAFPKEIVAIPEPEFCTDNAAMIGGAAALLAKEIDAGTGLTASASLAIDLPAEQWSRTQ